MGDMAEDMNALKRSIKEKRANQLVEAQDFKHLFTIHTEYHWSTTLQGYRLDYWPSGRRWRWRNKTYYGKPKDLMNFIAKRQVT